MLLGLKPDHACDPIERLSGFHSYVATLKVRVMCLKRLSCRVGRTYQRIGPVLVVRQCALVCSTMFLDPTPAAATGLKQSIRVIQ
jgi:hypothetical protein